ncbi:hypothetical protein Cflav_PD4066 [Pedosphaera parvula Ellin514]|uniref:Uncharacterized protein n=1 Tax=Pedosphaera parvula (strain Ellin514) TaxID=320771 RepID=B9XGX6_PEDPL|nr:hypothetical protein Cflav_PD4066 [Pedosphaera parvula Ellin514]
MDKRAVGKLIKKQALRSAHSGPAAVDELEHSFISTT